MNIRLMLSVFGAAILAGCCSCNCPVDSGTTYMKDALQPFVDNGDLPGAISILYRDGVQETCCVGYADVEAKRPITLDDVYMQCSQTKGFCGVTVAKLVEEGKLNLDDPVSKYLPEFATLWVNAGETNGVVTLRKAKTVLTVRMCLNHTGGFPFELPNGQAMGGWSRRMPLRSVAATAASQPIRFDPGTKASYSNVGIDIGAAVVEVVTGKRWEQYLQETVLDPLGMTSTGFWPSDDQLKTKIEMYKVTKPVEHLDCASWMQRPYNDDRVFSSAGAGLWTTARDQVKFYKMLMNLGVGENGVRVLKEETVKNLLAKSSRPKGLGGYSLGLSAPEEDNENATFGHGGAWGTSCNVNWHKRELRLWAVQFNGGKNYTWSNARQKAIEDFFKHVSNASGVDAYTGRLK